MKEAIIYKPNKDKCKEVATKIFFKEAGIDREGEKYERMRAEAMEVFEDVFAEINPRAAYSFYDEFFLSGSVITVDGSTLRCKAFERIEPKTVKGLWVFAATSGYTIPEGDSILQQVYSDIWGTAFTDAIRIMLRKHLAAGGFVSKIFGPGFYGMEMEEMKSLENLVDFAKAGVNVTKEGVLIPEKSCAGVVFATGEGYEEPGEACEFCKGSGLGCHMCTENMLKK